LPSLFILFFFSFRSKFILLKIPYFRFVSPKDRYFRITEHIFVVNAFETKGQSRVHWQPLLIYDNKGCQCTPNRLNESVQITLRIILALMIVINWRNYFLFASHL